ncbi:hypothetical protein SprV_0100409000 [Sparganum proliferum]
MSCTMLMDAYRDERLEVKTVYTTDGQLLNIPRILAPTRLPTSVQDLLFADDCALNIAIDAYMQRSMNLLIVGCAHFVQTVNTDKTVIMHQPSTRAEYDDPRTTIDGYNSKP